MIDEASEFRRQIWQRLKQCCTWALRAESGGEARNAVQPLIAAFNRRLWAFRVESTGHHHFDCLEKLVLRTPIWLLLSIVLLGVGGTALWIDLESNLNTASPTDQTIIRTLFASLDSIAIVAAFVLSCKEVTRRKHLAQAQARQVIQQTPDTSNSDALYRAVQRLHRDRASLSNLEIPRANLAGIDLQGSNLREANLQGAILQGANLEGAILRAANLQGANLKDTHLKNAILWDANLQGADLSAADLQGADLYEAELQGANLSAANLQGAGLSLTKLQGANLTQADLQRASLSGADLQGANLTRCNLRGAHLSLTHFSGANLTQANLSDADEWRDRQLSQARLCQTQLPAGSQLNRDRDCDNLAPAASDLSAQPSSDTAEVLSTGYCPILYEYARLHRGFLAFPRQGPGYYLACYLDLNGGQTGLPEMFQRPEEAVSAAIRAIDAYLSQHH